jgi:uncharacterized membrane protein YqaE (UPF0057 family)
MKKNFLLLLFTFFALSAFAFDANTSHSNAAPTADVSKLAPEVTEWSPEMARLTLDRFLNMTPKDYKKITGEKLGLKRTVALKMAQHKIKKHLHGSSPEDLDKTLYIVLAIFIPFVAVGIATDWKGSDWVIALLLSLLCGIPGIIYALIKMKTYYPS